MTVSSQGPLPWLEVGGVEVGNAARTMEYLKKVATPQSGSFDVADSYPCTVLYRVAGGTGPDDFDEPGSDGAPWFDSSSVLSSMFLGFLPSAIGPLGSTVTRASGQRFGGIEGVKLGPQHMGGRTVPVRGWLVANGGAALDWGLRWLTDRLGASDCDQCARMNMRVYAACPDGLGDSVGLYTLYDVGLVSGPTPISAPIIDLGCDLLEVEFTMVAENPWLYSPAEACLNEEIVGAEAECVDAQEYFVTGERGTAHCCEVIPPAVGKLGSIITITAPTGIGGLECGLFNSPCPPDPTDVPNKAIYVEKLLAGETLVIDSSRRQVTVSRIVAATPGTLCGGEDCPDVYTSGDGTANLHLLEGRSIEWLEVDACDTVDQCICVRTTSPCSGGADATVLIQKQIRVK